MDNAACTTLRGTFTRRIMKQQGHVVDEVVCFILLRLCFNSLRATWLPGGYPPKKDASKVRNLHSHMLTCILLAHFLNAPPAID